MGRAFFGSEPSRPLSLLEPSPTLDPSSQQSHVSLPPSPAATTEPSGTPVSDHPIPSRSLQLGNYAAAQDSLRQASETLDAAFERLRELRRSLSSFREGMTLNNSQGANVELRSRIGPSHAALVLTDASADNPNPQSPPTSELLNPPSTHTWTELGPFRFISRHIDDIPSSTRARDTDDDPGFSVPLPLPRAQHQWRISSRVHGPTDEPSTSLGRRVAARQAGDISTSGSRIHRSPSVADLLRAARRPREARPGSIPPGSTERPLSANAASLRALRDSRDRLRTEARTVPTRIPTRLPRPDDLDADQIESRSYRVRRRLNADGDELIYNINIDSDSPRLQEPTWDVPPRRRLPTLAFPSRVSEENIIVISPRRDSAGTTIPIEDGTSPALPPAVGRRLSSRRRGWARLDADGNEIPTDEEEALERARAQMRIRDQSYTALNTFQMVRDRLTAERTNEETRLLVPTTQFTDPGLGDDDSVSYVRVHINALGTVGADVTSDISTTQSYSSYRANPLPMPLEEMVDPHHSKQRPARVHGTRAVKLSRFAHLAGR